MKRLRPIIILLQTGFTLLGQDLRNTDWTKISAERKDGSKIVDHSGLDYGAFRYLFKDSTVALLLGDKASTEQTFSIKNRILSIGGYQHYHIDTLTTMTLVLTEVPQQQLTDDKVNRFIFINSIFHLRYLIQNKQIELVADTLVHCNTYFSPAYMGNLDTLFMSKFRPVKTNRILFGDFILTPDGNVTNINFIPNENFNTKDINKFKETLLKTSGAWVLPRGRKALHFKIDFGCRFTHKLHLSNMMFILHTQDPKRFEITGLKLQQIAEADGHFKKGLELLSRDKPEKAVVEFDKCLKIDSLYIDAYYNKAYSYVKLGNKKLACKTWSILKLKGQKPGEKLYKENCN